jgi:hypothetical protein
MTIRVELHYHKCNVAVAKLLHDFIQNNKKNMPGMIVSFNSYDKGEPLTYIAPGKPMIITAIVQEQNK